MHTKRKLGSQEVKHLLWWKHLYCMCACLVQLCNSIMYADCAPISDWGWSNLLPAVRPKTRCHLHPFMSAFIRSQLLEQQGRRLNGSKRTVFPRACEPELTVFVCAHERVINHLPLWPLQCLHYLMDPRVAFAFLPCVLFLARSSDIRASLRCISPQGFPLLVQMVAVWATFWISISVTYGYTCKSFRIV